MPSKHMALTHINGQLYYAHKDASIDDIDWSQGGNRSLLFVM